MPSECDKWGWKHVSVFGGFQTRTGTKRWKCNHCNLRYNGSYSRVRAHLLGFTGVGVKSCPAVDRSLRDAFQILEEERLSRKKKKIPLMGKSNKRCRSSQPNHISVGKTLSKDDVDDVVARSFYADGLNFDIVNSLYFQEMVKAIASFGPGYEPPSIEKLSGSFLSKEKSRMEKSIGPIKESWSRTGCTIFCLDQSTGTQGVFAVNIYASSSRGLIFLQNSNIKEGDGADDVFSNVLSNGIMEVGPANVLQIIVHPGHATKLCESLICSKFPQIFWSPCSTISITMFMEELAEMDLVISVVSCAKGIERYILSQQRCSPDVLAQNWGEEEKFNLFSAKLAPTYNLIWRILELKQALEEMVVSEEWIQSKLIYPEDILNIEVAIMGNDFWRGAHLFLQLCEPFVSLLGSLNLDTSAMGDVHEWRVQALEAVKRKGIEDIVLNQLDTLIENRWDMLFSPLHAAGYILNPKYFGKEQAKDKTTMRGWKATLERYECDKTARRILREQLSSYWRQEGSLGEEDAVDCRDKMDPVSWWENFGSETPQLQTLAIKILSQISSVSTFQMNLQDDSSSFQEAVRVLGTERAEELIFVRNNLRLHGKRPSNLCSTSATKMWDIALTDQRNGIIDDQNKL
ncbi:hypothetical protein GIB67_007518 [Kingdonia uniflora]|uniref:DUF659 domain-containing protein n=1 Tax=Kingdonia uniflora TaxID=39325 RepID=A0A7J7LW69_9MAGN|nr:hypothetical protein GIB67_007518 [Kingdonia uniflora]